METKGSIDMLEQKFRVFLKKHLERFMEIVQIETGSTHLGVADLYYYGKGFNGWMELKQLKSLPIDMNKQIVIPYRPGQLNFLRKHQKKGLNAFCLLSVEDKLFLITNFTKREFTKTELVEFMVIDNDLTSPEVLNQLCAPVRFDIANFNL
jgi:hypothetical protein